MKCLKLMTKRAKGAARMKPIPVLLFLSLSLVFMTSCAAAENQGDTNYETTKKMMVDMLKTDEGKAAIQDILADEDMREELVMDQIFVKQTIQETLASDEAKTYW